MLDTIENIKQDILDAAVADGALIAHRLDELWRTVISDNDDLQAENQKLTATIRVLEVEIKRLGGQIAKLNKMKFGPSADTNPQKGKDRDKSGTGSYGQPETGEGKPAEGTTTSEAKPRNQSGRGTRVWPPHLERREFYMGTKDGLCPCGCGGTIRDYDIKETPELIPAQFYIAVRKYPKYRCLQGKMVGTPFEPALIRGTTFSNGLLAHSIAMRFDCYLPWYRQERLFEACGISYPRSTLMRWATAVALGALLPMWQRIESEARSESWRLFMDESPMKELDPGRGRTRQVYLYALHRDDRSFGGNRPPLVIYYVGPTRSMKRIHEILSGMTAIVQTDAYSGYGRLGTPGTCVAGIKSPKCWSHARRKFTDEFDANKTPDADDIIQIIAELYAVEGKINGKPPDHRRSVRRKLSQPILDRLRCRLIELAEIHVVNNGMRKAIHYVLNHWAGLTMFVDDGRIDLDTNAVERLFKPTKLLAKNALFVGSDEGFEAWAILSSIVETCKLNRVRVEPYLKWIFDEISRNRGTVDYEKLLPWNAPLELRQA
ncbi:IS66 family transposase (plasmid) [Martelella lutilitoris]|uniref:IS66 family transposase n=1 Tax=Martelella lutilitoris TaxID=2583532 RepID=A0A7T7KPL7_9HYPH|nr:IS66 family transposase [Martelella lutilitoris]QQM33124.1 IS66 family transposase [Martelella lutilitoris]QRX65275.1 IS66 family transposase [Dysgonomonadaceae bacterium zrk40]